VKKWLLAGLALLPGSPAAAAAGVESICADRPGNATPTCTVPSGIVQVETGLADWIRDRSGGIRSASLTVGDTAVKIGVTDRLHIELDLTPFTRADERAGGNRRRASGLGDAGVALKYRMTADDAPVQFAVRPFVKLPVAKRSLGNGKVEGGAEFSLDSTFAGSSAGWNLDSEVDVVSDADGSGYHFAMAQAASAGLPLSDRFTVSAELWTSSDFDPDRTVRQYSIDAAAAYLVSSDVQLDAGVDLGLNRDTPDLEIYSGIAIRF
jgi:hypothetical protein